jgi:preprotein translocase subunit SecD
VWVVLGIVGCLGACLFAALGAVVFVALAPAARPPAPPLPRELAEPGEPQPEAPAADAPSAGVGTGGRTTLTLAARGGGQAELEEAASVLRQRLEGLGIDGQVRVEGSRLRVELPEAALERTVGLLTAGGRLQFKLVARLEEEAAQAEVARIGSLQAARAYDETKEPLDLARQAGGEPLLLENPGVEGYLVTRVYPAKDGNDRDAIGFVFGEAGRVAFRELTGQNVGRDLAIVLDGEVQTLANIASAVDGEGVMSREDGYPPEELERLLTLMRSGRLPVELGLEGE